jgi:beta-carotene 3-hydroxylase
MWFTIAFILGFLLTEGGAWSAHKYLMHGPLWSWHEDHHKPNGNLFQKNDRFFLVFAIPSWLCIMLGMIYGNYFVVGFGGGIALYGLVYFLIHDDNTYFRAIRKAHKVHHKNQYKEHGTCFGMLLVPRKYFNV